MASAVFVISPSLLAILGFAILLIGTIVEIVKQGLALATKDQSISGFWLQVIAVTLGALVMVVGDFLFGTWTRQEAALAAVFGIAAGWAASGHYSMLTAIVKQFSPPDPPV